MVDADHFKRINDAHGHEAGDRVLVALANRLLAAARPADLVGRLGGEEFVFLMPGCAAAEASRRAETLRADIAAFPVPMRGGDLSMTVSIGVAERGLGRETLEALMRAADEAMYAAKMSGRNRVVTAAS